MGCREVEEMGQRVDGNVEVIGNCLHTLLVHAPCAFCLPDYTNREKRNAGGNLSANYKTKDWRM